MSTTDVRGAHVFHNSVTFVGAVYLPDEAVDDDAFSTNANKRLSASKQVHRFDLSVQQDDGSDVVTDTTFLRICRGAGELKGFEVRPMTAPTGGDKEFTVDIQKASDGSGSWSSLLNAVETVDNTSTDDTLQSATLAATPTTADGDALRIVITASGSTGSQGQGVIVTAHYEEAPS
ncbi:MAG: hypothetical protein ACPGWS_04900 [Solirubrobacterales bacterium]